jgi:hypothetical protein
MINSFFIFKFLLIYACGECSPPFFQTDLMIKETCEEPVKAL